MPSEFKLSNRSENLSRNCRAASILAGIGGANFVELIEFIELTDLFARPAYGILLPSATNCVMLCCLVFDLYPDLKNITLK